MLEIAAVAAAVVIGSGVVVLLWRLAAGKARTRWRLALRLFSAVLIVSFVVLASLYQLVNSRTFQLFGEAVARIETDEPLVALTFDDGPRDPFTSNLLSILADHDVKATFFVTGTNLQKNEWLGRRIVREGHELGNHSFSHRRMVFNPSALIREEIEMTDRLIRQAGATGEIHFRSPYCKKFITLPLELSRLGRRNILFDVEPETDPEVAASAEAIAEHVVERVRGGSIILLHVESRSRSESLRAVPMIVARLQAKGYRFVTVSELLASGSGA